MARARMRRGVRVRAPSHAQAAGVTRRYGCNGEITVGTGTTIGDNGVLSADSFAREDYLQDSAAGPGEARFLRCWGGR